MSNETQIIIRHSEPSQFDESSYGTACKVMLNDRFDLYVQINKHEDEKPNWLFIGTFDENMSAAKMQQEIDNVLGK